MKHVAFYPKLDVRLRLRTEKECSRRTGSSAFKKLKS